MTVVEIPVYEMTREMANEYIERDTRFRLCSEEEMCEIEDEKDEYQFTKTLKDLSVRRH